MMQAIWEEKLEANDTEVHWSTGTILAVFFAASLVSAVFFGLGYSFGRGGTANSVAGIGSSESGASAPIVAQSGSSPDRTAKKVSTQAALRHGAAAVPIGNAKNAVVARRDTDSEHPAHAALHQIAVVPGSHAAVRAEKTAGSAATDAHGKAAAGAAHYMVQIGAIGDHKDARTLVAQLRKSGFHAGIYPGKRDKFLHVQIGPFTTAEQAQTIRHHVMARGYRAILKRAS